MSAGNVPDRNMLRQAKCSSEPIRLGPLLRDTLFMAGKSHRSTFMRQWRQYRDKTLVQVAEELHVTHGYLSKVERGLQPYNQEMLEKLADLYRCDVVDLLIRDPLEPEAIWSIWDRAKPAERRQIEAVAGALVSKTGTSG